MYTSVAKVASDRKRTSHGIGKSGDELILSGKTNERARDSIGKNKNSQGKNPMPEKFSFHKQSANQKNHSDPSDQMRTIEKPKFSQGGSRIKSAGRFELDTGWVELGYDEKKSKAKSRERNDVSDSEKEKDVKSSDGEESLDNGSLKNEKAKGNIYVSFQSNYDDDDARKVKDIKAKKLPLGGNSSVKSNDESFQTGAEFFETKKTLSSGKVTKGMEKLSELKGHKGTYDDVVPFHQASEQKKELKALRNQMHNSSDNRTEIQKSITAVETYKNKKETMKRNFNKRFSREIENIKLENKTLGEDIDFWLLIKKKREIEKNIQPDNNNFPNKDDENDVLEDASFDTNQKENDNPFTSFRD